MIWDCYFTHKQVCLLNISLLIFILLLAQKLASHCPQKSHITPKHPLLFFLYALCSSVYFRYTCSIFILLIYRHFINPYILLLLRIPEFNALLVRSIFYLLNTHVKIYIIYKCVLFFTIIISLNF